MSRRVCCLAILAVLVPTAALSQEPQAAAPPRGSMQEFLRRPVCPGDPPDNLASVDCSFTKTMRLIKFLGDGVTDQAIMGSTFYGFIAQLRDDPEEWDRNFDGYGRRAGSRYTQSFAKAAAAFGVGTIMGADPRRLRCDSDPRFKSCRVINRIGHAIVDWATVRRSARNGNGRRLPNLPLVAGAAASGFVGNLWYPDRLTTREETTQRIISSLNTALMSSFYNEFSPEVGRLLGGIFKRGRMPNRPQTGGPSK